MNVRNQFWATLLGGGSMLPFDFPQDTKEEYGQLPCLGREVEQCVAVFKS